MKTITILGENRFASHSKVREACRGIVVRDGKLLLTYEVNSDQWFLPGGGLEKGENLSQCCIRELAEETGLVVETGTQFATIHEYYEQWLFISHYFICEVTGQTERLLTERELEMGLEPRWIPVADAVEIFSHYQDHTHNEMKRGTYLREYEAMKLYLDLK